MKKTECWCGTAGTRENVETEDVFYQHLCERHYQEIVGPSNYRLLRVEEKLDELIKEIHTWMKPETPSAS